MTPQAEERKERYNAWFLNRESRKGSKFSPITLNSYIGAANRALQELAEAEKKKIFEYDDVSELKRIFGLAKRTQAYKNSDCKRGFENYIEFLSDNGDGGEETADEENVSAPPVELNTILYGPPGTGKTYNTVNYAVKIIDPLGYAAIGSHDEAIALYKKYERDGRIRFTTFHQSYGYEEFIEGIKPVTTENGMKYVVAAGAFKEFCDRAKFDPRSNYVFICDEINRGNVSKIFGELITLIEPTKRLGAAEETTCVLPYSREEFGVPKNVYLVGTMNTADRSLVQLDAALRRRFSFVEMMPDYTVLAGKRAGAVDVARMLATINERISALIDREHTIGHAYFTSLNENSTVEELAAIFKNKVVPLLQEYFYDDYEAIEKVLSSDFIERKPNPFGGREIRDIKYPTDEAAFIGIYARKTDETNE